MEERLQKLLEMLDAKSATLVDAIEVSNPLTSEYKDLLVNLDMTMAMFTNAKVMLETQYANQKCCVDEKASIENLEEDISENIEEKEGE